MLNSAGSRSRLWPVRIRAFCVSIAVWPDRFTGRGPGWAQRGQLLSLYLDNVWWPSPVNPDPRGRLTISFAGRAGHLPGDIGIGRAADGPRTIFFPPGRGEPVYIHTSITRLYCKDALPRRTWCVNDHSRHDCRQMWLCLPSVRTRTGSGIPASSHLGIQTGMWEFGWCSFL